MQIASLVRRADLNLLQLDAYSPNLTNFVAGAPSQLGLLADFLPLVHSQMYLRPQLCMASNAGQDIIKTLTSLAEFLVSNGSADLPVAAIRGDNIQSDLSFLPEALLPRHASIVAARVEIGAGPFATAWSEGARIVLAGCYDVAAPLIGAAVSQGWCGWKDTDRLALLSAAAQFEGVAIEALAEGTIEFERAAREQLDTVRAQGRVVQADVRCDYSALTLKPTPRNTFRPTGVEFGHTKSLWNARVVFESGFEAAALVTGVTSALVDRLDQLPVEFKNGQVTLVEYNAATRFEGESKLTRIEYRSPTEENCQNFVSWLELLLWRRPAWGKLISPFPNVKQSTETALFEIPTDAVTISVDTRPACEWL